jgi:hypothetical protein
MILFPRIGASYWYVTDFYETFVAIPVKLFERGGMFKYSNKTPALFKVRFELAPPNEATGDPGYEEIYDASRRELYKTNRQAQRVADKLNMKAGKMIEGY